MTIITDDLLSNGDIITEIFGETINVHDKNLYKKVILAPRNMDVLKLNEDILERLEGEKKSIMPKII